MNAPSRPSVSVILPVGDGWDETFRCLLAVARRAAGVSRELVVVDDATTDETRQGLPHLDGVRSVRNERPAGFFASCDRGAAVAQGEILLFLNRRAEPRDGWLAAVAEALADPAVTAAVPDPRSGAGGAYLAVKAAAFGAAGGFRGEDAAGLLSRVAATGGLAEIAEPRVAGQREEGAGPARRRVLVVHEDLPRHDRSGSDLRLLQVLRRLRALGHEVTYVARHARVRDPYQAVLEELGITVFAGDAERLAAFGLAASPASPAWRFRDVLAAGAFDVAILFHWFWSGISVAEAYLPDLRSHAPDTRVVVLTDDRHGLRERRGAELSGLASDLERAEDFTARELECYRAADLVAAITEEDRRGLLELDPALRVELLPMTVEARSPRAAFAERQGFVFLGDFDNLANRDALAWFLDGAWPRIRAALPSAQLLVAGNAAPAQLAERAGVVVLGHVADPAAALERARVFVSPIRFGTGIKTKNLLAMGHGLPLVTTAVGAEGIGLDPGVHALVAETAEAFATACVEAHEDARRWADLSQGGLRLIRSAFSVERLDRQLASVLDRACAAARPPAPPLRFSIAAVDEADPALATAQPPELRPALRRQAYLRLARELAEAGHPAPALQQVRHVFATVRGQQQPAPVLATAFRLLERCYRALGDAAAAERSGAAAAAMLPSLSRAAVHPASPVAASDRALSVIIPTFQRRDRLVRCLEALARQTLPADQFEVVVVDDGSTDGTGAYLSRAALPYRLVHRVQANRGAGAARRAGVDLARGTYLLLLNDDSVAAPDLLAEHLGLQRMHADARLAVLGGFAYPPRGRRSFLTEVLDRRSLLFPQRELSPDAYHGPACFVTCNLSVRRDLVLAVGSFDERLRVAEDTDLGLRLAAEGCQVVYLPSAHAWHDHLDLRAGDLVSRGRAYGKAWLRLLEKHPSLRLSQLGVELRGRVARRDVERVRAVLAALRPTVEAAAARLGARDHTDVAALLSTPDGAGRAAAALREWADAVPPLHWFHVLDGLCDAWEDARRPGAGPAKRAAPRRRPTLSLVVNARNEGARLPGLFASTAGVDTIVVADMESSDDTVDVARRHGAAVLSLPNAGCCEPGRQAAIDAAPGDWILLLDADERLGEGGVDAVRGLIADAAPGVGAFRLVRETLVGATRVERSGWEAEREVHVRLFRKGAVRWPATVHAVPEVAGEVVPVPRERLRIVHHNFADLAAFVEKTNRYTSIEARALVERGDAARAVEGVRRGLVEVAERYSPDDDGALSLALALGMLSYRVLAQAKAAEALGWPEERLPSRAAMGRAVGAFWDALQRDTVLARPRGAPARASAAPAALATIVIPVFNRADMTRACLNSLAADPPRTPHEIVVVDNGSSDGTAELLGTVREHVRVVRNAENRGFGEACNQGAAAARGGYLVFLNNDTTPRPGWLDALVEAAERDASIGAVGSRLVFPDGKLQEAGGIVFADATCWLFGRGDDPERAEYDRACEVDYASAAALLVRREVFEAVGGFDARYAPAYYEDTDLCFAIRALGRKVVYCPRSTVVHHESATAGSDPAAGLKRFLAVNRRKFLEKWRHVLADHAPSPEAGGPTPTTADRTVPRARALRIAS